MNPLDYGKMMVLDCSLLKLSKKIHIYRFLSLGIIYSGIYFKYLYHSKKNSLPRHDDPKIAFVS